MSNTSYSFIVVFFINSIRSKLLVYSTYLIRPSIEAADITSKDVKNDDNEEKCEEKSLEEVIYGESEELVTTDIWNQSENLITPQDIIQMISRQVRFNNHRNL